MTSTTNFISELIRAANEVDRLTELEKRRLLERGLITANALRGLLSASGRAIPSDAATEHAVKVMAQTVGRFSDDTVARSLLRLASEIRLLRIQNNVRLSS